MRQWADDPYEPRNKAPNHTSDHTSDLTTPPHLHVHGQGGQARVHRLKLGALGVPRAHRLVHHGLVPGDLGAGGGVGRGVGTCVGGYRVDGEG